MSQLVAIFNSEKKWSTRYDLFRVDNPEKVVGSIYWPKDAGPMPKEITVLVSEKK